MPLEPRAVILLVDDDEGDVLLMREALREFSTPHELETVWDGEEALDYLWRRAPRFSEAATPDLILLDLNLPRKNGREVFAELKAAPSLRTIPTVVLTTSTSDSDIVDGQDRRTNLYLPKPMRLEGYLQTVRDIERFWTTAKAAAGAS